jgi:hypothetical protein
MRKLASAAVACLSLLVGGFATGAGADELKPHLPQLILRFQTMYGVDGPFVGDANPIRDVVGDEAPWEIAFVRGRLFANGHLFILVRGLVFKDDPRAPAGFVGKNDEGTFRGLVSCLTEEGEDKVVTKNVVTAEFPANINGDSLIRADLELPNPCVAPIVMVLAGSEDKWFSVTGFEAEEQE